MLKAEEAGISPEQHIDAVKALHQTDFASFNIAVDNYYSTHSDENRQFSESIYKHLLGNGHIARRVVQYGHFQASAYICFRKTDDFRRNASSSSYLRQY